MLFLYCIFQIYNIFNIYVSDEDTTNIPKVRRRKQGTQIRGRRQDGRARGRGGIRRQEIPSGSEGI